MNDETNDKYDTVEQNIHNNETREEDNKLGRKHKRITIRSMILVVAIIIVGGTIINSTFNLKRAKRAEVISVSTLEKIINVSELSTFQAVYNGIAKVMNSKDKVDYYVSYMAKVNAGLEFDQIEIDIDGENKKIIITMPEIEITEVNVDIASLDYIFCNKKANTNTVSQEAYRACIQDVTDESSNEENIYDLAEQNAKNIVKALIHPFVEQLDSEYVLEIR